MQPKSLFLDVEANSYFGHVVNSSDSIQFAERELKERKEVALPPYTRIGIVDCDAKSAMIFKEQEFIMSVEYLSGRAYLKSNIEDGHKLSAFLNNLVKYRSLRKLKPWRVKIDPLDI